MNKKLKVLVPVVLLLMISIVSAALITHYGTRTTNIDVVSPIVVTGQETQSLTLIAGDPVPTAGNELNITNIATFDVDVEITTDAETGIEVDYTGTLQLTKKTPQTPPPWTATGTSITVTYTVVGDMFHATVSPSIDGYVLVYYSDREPRGDGAGIVYEIGVDTISVIPEVDDANIGFYDMCDIESYTACQGGKIWYVPSDDIRAHPTVPSAKSMDWTHMADYYWETELVQFNPGNTTGNTITIYPGQVLPLVPMFNAVTGFNGSTTVTTNVDPVTV